MRTDYADSMNQSIVDSKLLPGEKYVYSDNDFILMADVVKAISGLIAEANHGEPTKKTQQALHFLSALDRLTYAAGNYQNGQSDYYFELKMTNSSENSLRSLFNLLH